MILYKEFLRESDEYNKIMKVYNVHNLDYVADAYLQENDLEYSNRRKLEYPYTTLATMNTWTSN